MQTLHPQCIQFNQLSGGESWLQERDITLQGSPATSLRCQNTNQRPGADVGLAEITCER